MARLSQGSAAPDVITVCLESACAPYTSVQAAVSAIAPGGTVKVAQGVYNDVDGDGTVVEITKTLTLQGGYTSTNGWAFPDPQAYPTHLDGEGTARVVSIAADIAPVVEGFHIFDGRAGQGAGVYVSGGSPTLRRNRIHDNVATIEGCGLYVASGSPVVESNLIYLNQSDQPSARGGGVYVAGGTPLLQHNTLYSNAVGSGGSGGGIYVAAGGAPVVSATIVARNRASSGGGIYAALGAYPLLGYNDVWDNAADDTGGVGMGAVTVFTSTDPLFVDPDGGDFRLATGSPCVDQVPLTQTSGLDYEGHARPFGGHSDIGAHESYYAGTCFARLGSGRVYTTVQAAVDAAGAGDLIAVAGRCAGVETRGGLLQTAYISKALTLRGGYTLTNWSNPDWDAYPTVLDAQAQGRAIYVNSTGAVVVEGLRVSNGLITGTTDDNGGGFYLDGAAHVLRYNQVYSNAAGDSGGGLYVNSGARVYSNEIYSNVASGAGAAYIGGGGIYVGHADALVYSNTIHSNQNPSTGGDDGGGGICVRAAATVWGNVVYGNESTSEGENHVGHGGGICVYDAAAAVRRNTVYSNVCDGNGGGIYVRDVSGGVVVAYNWVYSNTAGGNQGYGGGGIYAQGQIGSASGPTVQHNTVSTNTAYESSDGGGIYISNYVLVQHNDIYSNSARAGGGIAANGDAIPLVQANRIYRNTGRVGLFSSVRGGGIYAYVPITIENNLIYDNVGDGGHGVFLRESGGLIQNNTIYGNAGSGIWRFWGSGDVPTIRNNVIVDNGEYGIDSAVVVTPTYCDVWGNTGGDYHDDARPGGAGMMGTDPLFVNPGVDFYLQSGSPCIGAADPNSGSYPDGDYDGVARPIGSRADVGAYEFRSGTCFARIGDAGQVYTDVQAAVDIAPTGGEVRVAGVCQGVSSRQDGGATVLQTVYISKALTLHGGYTLTNWATPSSQTVLDADGLGRGVYITGTGAVTVDGFIVREGQATSGGGLYVATALDPTIQNVVFYANQADDDGGGFGSAGGSPRLTNNTFVSNTAAQDGGAVYLGPGSPVISNTIVVSNAAASGGGLFAAVGAVPSLAYNDVWQNTGGNYVNVSAGETDMQADPHFVDAAGGDFHLLADSPCVHHGDPATGLALDFEGDARPLPAGGWYDIGADESVSYPDVDFEPHSSTMTGTPGLSTIHPHVLTNTGSVDDVYVLHHELITSGLGTGWQVHYTQIFTLAPGQREEAPITLDVPADAVSDTVATVIVTATSQLNDAAVDVVSNTTLVNWNPGVSLTPPYAESMNPGEAKAYLHTLANTGNAPDTFVISHTSAYGWSVLTPTQDVALGPGITTTLWVTVNVPATAPGGLVETVVVTASSLNPLSGVSAVVTDTIEVNHTTGERYVATNGSDGLNNCLVSDAPCRTIDHAVEQAVTGDLVKVAEGTYYEHNVTLNKNITLRGGYTAGGFNAWEVSYPQEYPTIVDAQGAGRVFYIFGAPTVEGFVIQGGATAGSGGGVYIYSSGSPVVRSNVISGNTAGAYGGGIHNELGNPTLEQNALAFNTAPRGGGFSSAAGSPGFWSNTVYDNVAGVDGGGVYVAGGSARIWHDTIYGNAADRGGGIFLAGSGSPSVKNAIVAENTAASSGGGVNSQAAGADLDYNDVWNNTNGDYTGATPGPSSIFPGEDPQFVNAASRNFHVWYTSPCVNEGDDTVVTEDFEGQPRKMGPAPDIGADEYRRLGVTLEPDNALGADSGATIYYYHTVTNSGNYTDTFAISAHSSEDWDVTPPQPVEVGPGEADEIEVRIRIPAQAVGSTIDTTVVTATSTINADESDAAMNTTTISRTYGASWKG